MAARARPLTAGEMAMASVLFGDAIDYSRVRVYNRRYLPFGLQPKNCAMAPNGKLYFHYSCFRDDFSGGDLHAQHWFMHEMTHVWQHQLGYPVRLRGAIRLGLGYRYALHAGASLADYNMEAQGELLADYFVLKCALADPRPESACGAQLAQFEQVLARFLRDPSDRANLPKGMARRLRLNAGAWR